MLLRELQVAIVVLMLGVGGLASAQDAGAGTSSQSNLPTVSNERLGTGVPSRLPKVEVQRPVFTIQSGGPVSVPKPTYRPPREIPPPVAASNAKSSLPMIEQTRPWQKTGAEPLAAERPLPPARQVSARTAPRSATPPVTKPPRQIASELLPQEQHKPAVVSPPAARPPVRPAAIPAPATEAPARVLNFSIN